MFPFADMLSTIRARYPTFEILPTQRANDTAKTHHVPGFRGKIGFITSMTENFCGSCNRLRITCDGNIKACLFGSEEVSLRDLLREYRGAEEPVGAGRNREEMSRRLLETIGGAVGRKEEGHKPAKELAEGKNRPMILIGG
jgi:cyclic pyranopterin phosphate synthase